VEKDKTHSASAFRGRFQFIVVGGSTLLIRGSHLCSAQTSAGALLGTTLPQARSELLLRYGWIGAVAAAEVPHQLRRTQELQARTTGAPHFPKVRRQDCLVKLSLSPTRSTPLATPATAMRK